MSTVLVQLSPDLDGVAALYWAARLMPQWTRVHALTVHHDQDVTKHVLARSYAVAAGCDSHVNARPDVADGSPSWIGQECGALGLMLSRAGVIRADAVVLTTRSAEVMRAVNTLAKCVWLPGGGYPMLYAPLLGKTDAEVEAFARSIAGCHAAFRAPYSDGKTLPFEQMIKNAEDTGALNDEG